ncbi:MAG TPA: LamG-like jellyroll fold domain-containing protein [Verrucomicrobiae bacterium]
MIRLTHPKESFRLAAIMVLALCAQGAGAADYQTTVTGYNPLGYWRLNETTPSPALNKLANASALGSAADGYAVLDVGKGETGVVGKAIRLNNPGAATGFCGSRVDVPYNSALNPMPPFSIEFWAKPNSLAPADATGLCPLSNFDPNWYGGGDRAGWLFYVNPSGRWQFRLGNTGGYAGLCTATSGNAANGVWQHIVATYDGTTALLYANGVQIGSVSAPVANWARNPQMALRIGGTSLFGTLGDAPAISYGGFSGNRGWDGWIDELALYSKLLSPDTIAAHYSAATTNTAGYDAQILADGPDGYWNLDESAVTPPDPSTFPVVTNLGSIGTAADATVKWGAATAQTGSGYAGLGADNKACFFDGVNGGIQVADAPGLHFSGNLTMMAWVKPVEQDFFRDIIAHGWNNAYAETFLRISRGPSTDFYGDGNYYEVGVTDGSAYYDAAYFRIPPGDIGNWVHLAGSYDGANWNLYRNGVLVTNVASTHGALDVTNQWSIGSRGALSPENSGYDGTSGSVGLRWAGWIDEPAIFNTALPAAAINTIYNSAQVSPVITRAPQVPQNVYKGSSASFSVLAEGSPPLSYLWTSNGISTGVTTTSLTLNNLAAGTLTVQAIVTNPYGSTTGTVSFVVVAAPPTITQQPQPITRYTGLPFTFSVVTEGTTPMTFQWYKDGAAIAGANSSAYSGTTGSGTAGSYYCAIINEAGTANSTTNALAVLPIPTGYAAAVIADAPQAYWRLGEASGTVANDYYGGNNGTYFSALLGQPGYSVLDSDTAATFSGVDSYVGNISGTAINFSGTSANFTLEAWVKGQPGQIEEATIIAKGAGSSGTTAAEQFALDVSAGVYRFFTRGNNNAFFEARAVDGPNGSWQHVAGVYDSVSASMTIYVNGQAQGTGGTRPAGVRTSSALVSIGSKHLGNDPAYDGSFKGTIDEVAIYPTALTFANIQAHYSAAYGSSLAPFIAVQPVSLTNYVSLPGVFSVSAAGSQPLSYQWKKNGADIAFATDSAYTNSSLVLADAGNYSVTVANAIGTTNSDVVSLTVLLPPTTPVMIPGLVLHLPFENSVADTSGRNNNGTAKGAITYVTDGALGRALHYFTDPAVGTNYVTLGVVPDLQFSSNVDFSVSYWIRLPANYQGGDLPFFTDTVGSTFGNGYVFAPSYGPATANWPGGWAASIYGTGGGWGVYGDIGSINDGNWHHLLHSISRHAGAVTYLDGKVARENLQGGTTAAAAGDITTGAAATIGQDPNGTYNEPGSADIDDLGVWRKALSPLEAASIYMAAISNKVSFAAGGPISLTITRVSANQIQISWPAGTLQAADKADGPYTPISASSPYPVTIPATGNKFYRVAQ